MRIEVDAFVSRMIETVKDPRAKDIDGVENGRVQRAQGHILFQATTTSPCGPDRRAAQCLAINRFSAQAIPIEDITTPVLMTEILAGKFPCRVVIHTLTSFAAFTQLLDDLSLQGGFVCHEFPHFGRLEDWDLACLQEPES